MSRWDHPPCPGGCGELADECMTPGCGSPLGSMRIVAPVGSGRHVLPGAAHGRGDGMSATLNAEALEDLVRHAMASGAACFMEKAARGQVALNAPLMDAFGDFPAEFLRLRQDLTENLINGGAS